MQQCMGCLGWVFGKRRRSNRLRYMVNYGENNGANEGLEFENLFSDDEEKLNYGTTYNFVTKEEKDLVSKKQYDKIVEQQKAVDNQIREQTFKQEEQLKYEEERFDEAQNEATKAAMAVGKLKVTSSHIQGNKNQEYNLFSTINDSDSEDDFEAFLESVKQRSEAFRSDKGSFCESIPPSSKTIISQPKKMPIAAKEEDFKLPERDGNADGMSDDSFTFDGDNKTTEIDNTEWDTFVTGVENNGKTNNNNNKPICQTEETTE